jgi:uncharacterized protein YjbI with pentapeptide repeats
MGEERVIDLAREGADFPRRSPSGHLVLRVTGTVTGLNLSGLAWRSIVFEGPWWSLLVPGPARRVVADCDFSGMRTKHLDLGRVRFERCRFEQLNVQSPMGTRCALLGCTFSGRFEGNVSAQNAEVEGNDFSAVLGMDFRDGVDWRANRFDLGRSQLLLQAGTGFYQACEALQHQDRVLGFEVGRLAHPRRGPIGHPGQDWVLLQESSFPAQMWEQLLAVYDGPALDRGTGHRAAGPARPESLALAPGADLADAGLLGSDLAGADLRGAVLRGADLRAADLTGADLTGADLTDADAREATLAGARLAGAVMRYAVLLDAVLTGADLTGADLRQSEVGRADASGASLRSATLCAAGLRNTDLSHADLTGADLTGADLTGADLTGADLTGADLTAAVLQDAELAGVRHGQGRETSTPTRWPEGFDAPPKADRDGHA